jgi:hypothetical protein
MWDHDDQRKIAASRIKYPNKKFFSNKEGNDHARF